MKKPNHFLDRLGGSCESGGGPLNNPAVAIACGVAGVLTAPFRLVRGSIGLVQALRDPEIETILDESFSGQTPPAQPGLGAKIGHTFFSMASGGLDHDQ